MHTEMTALVRQRLLDLIADDVGKPESPFTAVLPGGRSIEIDIEAVHRQEIAGEIKTVAVGHGVIVMKVLERAPGT